MSHPYTDRYGYPLTAVQALARMNSPKRRGYYNAQGKWVRLGATAKRTPAVKPEDDKGTPSSGG